MVRKTYSAMAVIAIAAMSIVSCGKENVADLNDTWTKAENDLNTKLSDVHNEHSEILSKFTVVQTIDITDTAKMQDRKVVDQMIQDHEKAIGDVEKTANDLKAKREELTKDPKRADFEAAWKDAEVKFAAASEALDKIKSQDGDMKSKIDGLSHAAVKPIDTAAVSTTPTVKDTAVLMDNSKMDKMKEGTKMEKKDTASTMQK